MLKYIFVLNQYYQENKHGQELYDCMRLCLDSCEGIVNKYKELAKKENNMQK